MELRAKFWLVMKIFRTIAEREHTPSLPMTSRRKVFTVFVLTFIRLAISLLLKLCSRYRKASRSRSVRLNSLETRSEEHTSELQSRLHLVCRLLLEKKK